jgi:Cu/Zn superoxide dismutase
MCCNCRALALRQGYPRSFKAGGGFFKEKSKSQHTNRRAACTNL